MPYIVDVSAPLPDDLEPVVEVIARAFDIAPEKAAQLIARAPGPITRPVSEREARAVAQVVAAAGLDVHVREAEGAGDARVDDTTDETDPDRPEGAAHARDSAGLASADRDDGAADADRSSDATAAPAEGPPPAAPGAAALTPEPARVESPDPAPEAYPARTGSGPQAPGRARTIAAAVLPVVVALLVALGAVIGILYPNWRSDGAEAAAREARALAVAVDAAIDAGGVPLDEAAPATEALTTAAAMRALAGPVRASRRALEPEGYAFVLVTGPDAERRAGWPTPRDLDPVLADAARRAVRGEPIDGAPVPWGLGAIVTVEDSTRVDAPSGRVEVAVAPLERDGSVVGHVVIGAPGGAADARLRLAIQITAGAGAALLLVALLFGAALGSGRTRPTG